MGSSMAMRRTGTATGGALALCSWGLIACQGPTVDAPDTYMPADAPAPATDALAADADAGDFDASGVDTGVVDANDAAGADATVPTTCQVAAVGAGAWLVWTTPTAQVTVLPQAGGLRVAGRF